MQGTTPRSPGYLAHPAPSPPHPSCALPLTSGPSRQDKRQQAEPGGAHAPGHGGSGPLRAPRSQAPGHTSPPARRRRVWNPLLSQRLPAQLLAIGRERSALSSTGLRHRVEEGTRPPGGDGRGRRGRSRRDPWGAKLAQVTRSNRGKRIPSRWARPEGRGPFPDSGFQELNWIPLCTAARFLCPSLC